MNRFAIAVFFFAFIAAETTATVRLPKIFSDNMVLQRDVPLKIWGWSEKNSAVSLNFVGQTVKVKANSKGMWVATLKPLHHGGPFEMQISDRSGSVQLSNILIGDVWLGSGQSNMEWVVKDVSHAQEEIAKANYDKLRLYTVSRKMSYSPREDVEGGPWQVCSSATVGDFSAVAYFFGRKLYEELDVPIGLINSSWGGTNIETWMSWDVMSMDEEYRKLNPKDYEETAKQMQTRVEQYEQALKNDRGLSEKWFDPSYLPQGWKKTELPADWSHTELNAADGIVWFRREIELPNGIETQKSMLALGPIDDWDNTYVNGVLVGSTSEYTKDRQYALEAGVLRPGKNIIVVKVTDTGGGGGIDGRKDQLFLDAGANHYYSLSGEWEYKASVLSTDFGIKETGPNTFPSQLYNAMIAPLTSFAIKGVIWYQGEANVSRAHKYQTQFPALIKNWRDKWGIKFPFFWVQLANFLAPSAQPQESSWAELREAQNMTLSVPLTGQAVAIDIGEANDIHPRNKQDVGLRLALAALKVAYGKDVVYSGPVYKSMSKEGSAIKLSFSNIGGGLQARDKYGYLKGFAIAGADKKFYWAKAYVDGDQVVVRSDQVNDPVAVRYGWANNPDDVNLYNAESLPASPFRTDTWPGVTE